MHFPIAGKLTNPALAAQMLAALSSTAREESTPLVSLEPPPLLPGMYGREYNRRKVSTQFHAVCRSMEIEIL